MGPGNKPEPQLHVVKDDPEADGGRSHAPPPLDWYLALGNDVGSSVGGSDDLASIIIIGVIL